MLFKCFGLVGEFPDQMMEIQTIGAGTICFDFAEQYIFFQESLEYFCNSLGMRFPVMCG